MANYAISALKLTDTYVNTLPYSLCETAADTAAKAVSAGEFSLETGASVNVKFKYTNSAETPTLNVSSTGAKPIYYKGINIIADYLKADYTYTFVYNGNQWDLVGETYNIIDNLTTEDITNPLSANQGVILKALIDALQGKFDSLVPVFVGTTSQYEEKKTEVPDGAIVIITDDAIGGGDVDVTSSILGTGALGYLILE